MTIVKRIEAWACRAPIRMPVATSFGIMRNRPAVFVRIEGEDGAFGWGEAFANWPAAGAEHRVNLLMDDVASLLLGRDVQDPTALFHDISASTHIRALQCGEWGPFRQVVAALDTALWDLAARRAGISVAKMLDPGAAASVPAYASGIHIDMAAEMIPRARDSGFNAFKVKVGFDLVADIKKVTTIASGLESNERLFADANQAWTRKQSMHFAQAVASLGIEWLEEPMPADADEGDWRRLAAETPVPLAGGENLAGFQEFTHSLSFRQFRFVQPDVAKWGGLTGCCRVAYEALEAGQAYCPHFLGGGVGLIASAHLLAAIRGPGLLEVDVNPNPLRDAFGAVEDMISVESRMAIGDKPGLGIEHLPDEMTSMITLHREITASQL